MMWDIRPRRVLLAVESTDSEPAQMYAVEEARRRRCGVHVVHVVPTAPGGPGTDAAVIVNGELRRLGQSILAEVAHAVERRLDDPDVTVSTELCHGPVVSTLVHESRHASVVVLQHRGMGLEQHRPVLSVTCGVAARSHAPVVAVPAGWQHPGPDVEPVVTVGLAEGRQNQHLVDVAAEAAERMSATLRIVHAGDYLSLHELGTTLPGVPLKYVNCSGEPADALLATAPDTMLFVVGRRHPRLPLGQHLGPVARTLLHRSPVPVLVVDPCGDDVEAGRDLATAAVP